MREASGKSATVFRNNHETKLNAWNRLNARAAWIEVEDASKAGSWKAIEFLKFVLLFCHAQNTRCQTQDGIQPLRGGFFGCGSTSTRRSTELHGNSSAIFLVTENSAKIMRLPKPALKIVSLQRTVALPNNSQIHAPKDMP